MLKNDITFNEIEIGKKTILEYIAVRLTFGQYNICLINCYMPPYSTKTTMIAELSNVLFRIRNEFKYDDIIITGDFNLSNIEWNFFGDDTTTLTPVVKGGTRIAHNFIEVITKYNLVQSNTTSNSLGNYLDLVLNTATSKVSVAKASQDELIDNNSISHDGFVINFNTPNAATTQKFNIIKGIRLANAKLELDRTQFELIDVNDISLIGNKLSVEKQISDITDKILAVQENNTTKSKISLHNSLGTHPWTRNKKYKELCKYRNLGKQRFSRSPNELHKELLRICNKNQYSLYKKLKDEYYRKVIQSYNH